MVLFSCHSRNMVRRRTSATQIPFWKSMFSYFFIRQTNAYTISGSTSELPFNSPNWIVLAQGAFPNLLGVNNSDCPQPLINLPVNPTIKPRIVKFVAESRHMTGSGGQPNLQFIGFEWLISEEEAKSKIECVKINYVRIEVFLLKFTLFRNCVDIRHCIAGNGISRFPVHFFCPVPVQEILYFPYEKREIGIP